MVDLVGFFAVALFVLMVVINPLLPTLNRRATDCNTAIQYSNTVIGTLAVFGQARPGKLL